MKFEHEDLIDLETVGCDLMTLRHLLCLHYEYFKWSREYITAHPQELTVPYEQHNALVSAIIDVLDNIREATRILIERTIAADEKSSPTGRPF